MSNQPNWPNRAETNLYDQAFNQRVDMERQTQIQRDLGIIPPADRHPDVRFRGKPLSALTHQEAFEALQQAITHLKALSGHTPPFTDLNLG